MKLLKRYFIFSFFMLLMLSFVIPALAQDEKKDDLIGHWTCQLPKPKDLGL